MIRTTIPCSNFTLPPSLQRKGDAANKARRRGMSHHNPSVRPKPDPTKDNAYIPLTPLRKRRGEFLNRDGNDF